MNLYRKLIRPMRSYLGPVIPIEKEVKWYPEEEREYLENKYASYNNGISDLIFEEKYEPYVIEPKFKKFKVPEKCGECKSCQVAITGSPYYCNMAAVSSANPQMNISTIQVDPDSRPVWCPIIKMNDELDGMPIEKRSNVDNFMTGLASLFGGEGLLE